MSKVTVLGSGEISKLINIRMAIDAVEQAYIQKSSGSGGLWPMVFHEFEPGVADLDIKSGDLGDSGFFGLKLVSWYGENPSCSLPALFGTALLFDIRTGEPKALLNAGGITAYRTGAGDITVFDSTGIALQDISSAAALLAAAEKAGIGQTVEL